MKNISLIIIIGLTSTFFLTVTGFCFEEMRYLSKYEINIPTDQIVHRIAEYGLAKKKFVETQSGAGYDYDDADMKKISQNVDNFLKKHPEHIKISRNYSIDGSEAYEASVSYIFTDKELMQVNAYESGKQKFNKKIIGISYWQSYSACGHPTFGMQDDIYENDMTKTN